MPTDDADISSTPAIEQDEQGAASTPSTDTDFAAELATQLMAGTLDGVELEPKAEPEPAAAPEPDAAPEPAADPEAKADAPPAPKPTAKKPTATPEGADGVTTDVPEIPHPFDREDDPQLEGTAPERTRKSFERLRENLRGARQEGEFGRTLLNVAVANGLEPDDLAAVVNLTARAKAGDPAAKARLVEVMTSFGVVAPPPAPSAPAAPREPTATMVDKVYNDLFAADVRDLNIPEERARELAKQVAARDPALLQSAQPPPQPAAPAHQAVPPTPAQPSVDPVRDSAITHIASLDEKYTNSYKQRGLDFTPVRELARDRIAKRVHDEKAPPILWPHIAQEEIRKIEQERAKRPAAKPKGTALGASSNGTPANAKGFEQPIVGALMSGNLDNL